ncbi:MAG: tetratricopeptide repeat protein [Leptospiraceae bacterium]|nr:tetratricopeptide repeat protein [Leptospiraceae bacterium]MDW7975279.1 tetratricopeptide repeat protein [Leptospiraceae bacterium]
MKVAEKVEELWEYYTQKKFREIQEFYNNKQNNNEANENIKELYYLSLIETNPNEVKVKTNGIFKELLEAMIDYYSKNYHYSARKLSTWILTKGYYSDWIIERFFDSAKKSQQYDTIIRVANSFLKKGILKILYVKELFHAYYKLKDYQKALEVFEQYREVFDDEDLFHVGLIYLKTRKYKEAERVLLAVYKKITGKEYLNHYDKYESYYKQKYQELKQKYLQNQLETYKELSEYGMACLFSGDYRTALNIFTTLKKELTEK